MTTDNTTGEYPLRTLTAIKAAQANGEDLLLNGVKPWGAYVNVSLDDLDTIVGPFQWTARPRKPKEFDFWEAGEGYAAGKLWKCSLLQPLQSGLQ